MLTAQQWSVDAQLFLLAHISRNKATVVIMTTKCNTHQQYSAVFQWLYHGLSPFLYKTFDQFWQGQSNKHPQSITTHSRSYLQYRLDYNSNMHTFLYYTDNLNAAHYTFTAINMWNNADCNTKYTYIVYKQLSITVETSLLIILLPSCNTSRTSRLKL